MPLASVIANYFSGVRAGITRLCTAATGAFRTCSTASITPSIRSGGIDLLSADALIAGIAVGGFLDPRLCQALLGSTANRLELTGLGASRVNIVGIGLVHMLDVPAGSFRQLLALPGTIRLQTSDEGSIRGLVAVATTDTRLKTSSNGSPRSCTL